MSNKRVLGALVALGIVLAACGGGNPSATAGGGASPSLKLAADQVFRFGATEPPTLDPQKATDSASIVVLRSITRPLVYFDPDLKVVTDGGLAEKYDVSADGKTVTFTLKSGIKYSNGDAIKASDFVYAFQRLIDPRTAAGYSYVMGDVVGAGDLLALDPTKLPADAALDAMVAKLGVEAPDDSTFVVHLANPTAYFPYIVSLWVTAPVQKAWITAKDATEAKNFVGSGPFNLSQWEHNAKLVMKANPNWTGAKPKLAEVDMTLYSDTNLTYDAYRNDELDMTAVPSANRSEVTADPDLTKQVIKSSVLATYYIGFDMRGSGEGKPVSLVGKSKELRYAFSESVDRDALVNTVNQGVGTAAMSMVPKGMQGVQPDIGLKFDATKAKADLATALTALGVTAADLSDGGKSAIELGFNSGAGHEPIMEFLQAQWNTNLGIKVKLSGLEWKSFLARLDEQPFTMYRLGWGADYPHPNNFLRDVFGCTGNTPNGNNEARWCNAQFNDLLNQAATKPDIASALPLYNQAQQNLVDDAPVIFLYRYGRFTLVKPWVQGLTPTAQDSTTGELFFDRIQIAEHT
jgi:oligopeptide transport system substrate-binding protein